MIVDPYRQIANSTSNDGNYSWEVWKDVHVADDYRIMVICGSATGYSEIFEIQPSISTDENSWGEMKKRFINSEDH